MICRRGASKDSIREGSLVVRDSVTPENALPPNSGSDFGADSGRLQILPPLNNHLRSILSLKLPRAVKSSTWIGHCPIRDLIRGATRISAQLHHWKYTGSQHRRCKTGQSHDQQHHRMRFEHFLFRHSAHSADDPETAIVHPRNRFGTASNG